MRLVRCALVLAAVVVPPVAAACSSPDSGGPTPQQGYTSPSTTTTAPGTTPSGTTTATSTSTTPPPPPTTKDETWSDGKILSGAVVIAAGATVTIAPGAKITASAGTSVTIAGTLTASSQATHASITGTGWTGLVVAGGGTLDVTGVDLSGAGIEVQASAAKAEYDYGTLSGATAPFTIDAGAVFGTANASVSAIGPCEIGGELDASYLDYNSNGSLGMTSTSSTAVFKIDNSRLYGSGNQGGDMISISGATSVHLGHTEIHDVHCAFHFTGVDSIDVSFMDIHDNSYGFMLYGSANTGTRTIASSNIYDNAAYGADEGSAQTQNGLITFENGYWSGNGPSGGTAADNVRKFTNAITVTNMSTTTKVTGVGPQ